MDGMDREPASLFGAVRERIDPRIPYHKTSIDDTPFAHESERLFARLLDFYGTGWLYEPLSFELADEAGEVGGMFTPDFYLPEYDLFVEITTMSQKLVTRKNRKIRLLHEQYPDARCRIFYQRDIFRLAVKHGLEIPTEDLTSAS